MVLSDDLYAALNNVVSAADWAATSKALALKVGAS
jgi:hypothetical protein